MISVLLISSASHAQEIRLYTEDFKPYQYLSEEGKPIGFGVELVQAIFLEANIGIREGIRLAIWDSAYQTVLKEDNSALFMTVRNDKRENLFKWVGPLASREMWLYKLSERNDIKIDTLSDAKKYIVGGYKSAQTDYLIELGFPRLDIVLKEALNFKKLLAGRIDLMPSSEIMMASKLKDAQISLGKVEKAIIFDERYKYYLALNKSVPDEIVETLQKALMTLKANGQYSKLEDKYLSDEL
jgi:polar amino acid transport system substrate-binding protein